MYILVVKILDGYLLAFRFFSDNHLLVSTERERNLCGRGEVCVLYVGNPTGNHIQAGRSSTRYRQP